MDTVQLEATIASLEMQVTEQTELANGYLAQLQRVQADFENFQKRIEIEKGMIADIACGEFITGLLDTLDNFERALDSMDSVSDEDIKGVRMVYQGLMDYLQSYGLEKIISRGQQFDPHKHEAVMQQESEDDDGIVLDEFQCGYALKGKVIRPSKVKVARQNNNTT
jgi:molecular chaperone GrpE